MESTILFIIIIVVIVVLNRWAFNRRRKRRRDYYRNVYLKSDAWRRKRYVVLKRDNWRCVYCGAKQTAGNNPSPCCDLGCNPKESNSDTYLPGKLGQLFEFLYLLPR